MPHRKAKRFVERYLFRGSLEGEPMDSIRSLSFLLGFAAIFMASFAFNYDKPFFGGGDSSIDPIWHIRPAPFPLWEVVFLFGGVAVLVATYLGRGVVSSHWFLGVAWLTIGVTWITYGVLFHPDYVFALGVFSVFMSAQHAIMAKIWAFEKVI